MGSLCRGIYSAAQVLPNPLIAVPLSIRTYGTVSMMRSDKYGPLSCGRPLAVNLNAVIDDAVKGMRIGNADSIYGRYSCGAHAYGQEHTVDAYMRWLNADAFAVPTYGDAVPWYTVR